MIRQIGGSVFCRVLAVPALVIGLAACAGPAPELDDLAHNARPVGARVAFEQPPEVLERFFPDPQVTLDTPAFRGETALTDYEQMTDFIASLRQRSANLHVLTLGYSQQGRRIPMLVFTTAPGGTAQNLLNTDKPTVWIHAQLHGNEPAGGEGALALASELTGSMAHVLDRLNVVVVPRVNVDGSVEFERHTADSRDLNRDALRLDVQESLALRRTNIAYRPVVTVDAHEYSAARDAMVLEGQDRYLESHDMLIQGAENPNVPLGVRQLTQSLFIDAVRRDLASADMSAHEYFIARTRVAEESGETENIDLYAGGTAARIGRNFHGLLNQVSILLESRGIGIGLQSYRRRVYSHLLAMRSIVDSAWREADQVQRVLQEVTAEVVARGAVVGDDDPLVLQASHNKGHRYQMPYINAQTGRPERLPTTYHRYNPAIAKLTRERPYAYILPPEAEPAVMRLKLFGIRVVPLHDAGTMSVQAYRVAGREVDKRAYEGVLRNRVKVKLEELTVAIPAGSHIVYLAQPLGNLAAELLEPECGDSFVTFGVLTSNPDGLLPVYRYMEPLSV